MAEWCEVVGQTMDVDGRFTDTQLIACRECGAVFASKFCGECCAVCANATVERKPMCLFGHTECPEDCDG